jgi:Caulimovirus viroplasmin
VENFDIPITHPTTPTTIFMKFNAIVQGRRTGIVRTWEECQSLVRIMADESNDGQVVFVKFASVDIIYSC